MFKISVSLATRGIICTEGGDGTGPGPDVPVPVCDPEPTSIEVGMLFIDADDLDVEQIEPAWGQELLPNRIEAEDVLPTLNTYSLPINL